MHMDMLAWTGAYDSDDVTEMSKQAERPDREFLSDCGSAAGTGAIRSLYQRRLFFIKGVCHAHENHACLHGVQES